MTDDKLAYTSSVLSFGSVDARGQSTAEPGVRTANRNCEEAMWSSA
jgi:hypothetical protein